jgi:hypothetical protein
MAHFDLKSADASCARADKEKLRKATHTAAIVNTLKSILFIIELQLDFLPRHRKRGYIQTCCNIELFDQTGSVTPVTGAC